MAAVTKSEDRNKAMADDEGEARSGEPQGRTGKNQPGQRKAAPAKTGGFFTIYKTGHGYWTRMGTAIGAGALGLVVAFELYNQIPTFLHGEQHHDQRIALIVASVFMVAWALWAWWFTNKPTTAEFLIQTDSEMKKVNWTSRKELIGSTKIVIGFVIFVAVFLFTCDLLFGAFFHLIGVLKTIF